MAYTKTRNNETKLPKGLQSACTPVSLNNAEVCQFTMSSRVMSFARFGRVGRFGADFFSVASLVSAVSVVLARTSFWWLRSFRWFRLVVSGFST